MTNEKLATHTRPAYIFFVLKNTNYLCFAQRAMQIIFCEEYFSLYMGSNSKKNKLLGKQKGKLEF